MPHTREVSLPRGNSRTGRLSHDSRGRGLEVKATNVDHFDAGYMHAVKDQGGCGSCWAFTTTTALEGTIAKKNDRPNPERLSEQQSVDCTLYSVQDNCNRFGACECWGCQGCWMEYSWDFMRDHGVMTEAAYPYVSGTNGGNET